MTCKNHPECACPIGAIRASAHPVAVFSESLDLLHRAMRSILYRHIAMAMEMTSKVGTFYIFVLLIVVLAVAGAIRSE